MVSLNPLKNMQKNHPKEGTCIGRKLLHTVIKVNNSIFLSCFRFFSTSIFATFSTDLKSASNSAF
jgi:hypothetical protein